MRCEVRRHHLRLPRQPGRLARLRGGAARRAARSRRRRTQADLVVVNTCSVTATADQGARQTIRRIARDNPAARIVVTGCYATRRPDEVRRAAERRCGSSATTTSRSLIDAAAPTDLGLTTARALRRRRRQLRRGDRAGRRRPHGVHAARADRLRRAVLLLHHSDDARRAAERAARRRAARGRARGGGGVQGNRADRRPPRLVRPRSDAARRRCRAAARARRVERDGVSRACPLPHQLARADGLLARDRRSGRRRRDRFAPHFHLPLQHASNRVLAAMRRPYTIEYYAALVDDIRARIPHASIGSDIIVGFPGRDRRGLRAACGVSRALAADARSRVPVFGSARARRRRRCAARCRARSFASAARAVREIGQRLDRAVPRRRRSAPMHRALTLEDGIAGGDRQLPEGADSAGPRAQRMGDVRIDGDRCRGVVDESSTAELLPAAGR